MDAMSDDPLLGLVCAIIEHHGYVAEVVDEDQVELRRPDQDAPGRLYLTNLRQWAAREPRDQWPAIAADFVGSVIATAESSGDDALDLGDYAMVRPLLRTRLYGDDFGSGAQALRRPVAPGLVEVLVVDKPTAMMIVNTDLPGKWGMAADELFAVAEENVRRDGPLELVDDDYGGVRLFSLGGDYAYATAHALWAGDYPVTGPYGALVVVPAQGVVHAVPVHGEEVVAAMNLLVRIGWGGFRQGPRSITPNVYWWRDGALRLAGAVEVGEAGDAGEDSLAVSISGEFQELLEELVRE
ncbi:hypothetical protein [Spirillospora sp. NPDC029432]|uniref:hypothetical protein n=1 Tax=Spirillospora sp. NPDC029432 TaxID=3154599 RepID=UPI0034511E40